MPAQKIQPFDIRMYIGMIVFRWQLIVLVFLCCVLGGVLYIRLTPSLYRTECKLMIYRDPNLQISGAAATPWTSFNIHGYLLRGERLREKAVDKLFEKWGETMRDRRKMMLETKVRDDRDIHSTLNVSVDCMNATYAREFLTALLREHEREWEEIQRMGVNKATDMLARELTRLEGKIKEAEDNLIDYMRLHDIPRVRASATMESQYLGALMARRNALTTEMMLLEASFPHLKDANAAVISDVSRLTRETGAIEPTPDDELEMEDEPGASGRGTKTARTAARPKLPARPGEAEGDAGEDEAGWQDLRVKLLRLRQQEKELMENLKPEHPKVKDLQKEIKTIENRLELAIEIEISRLRDRHKALKTHLSAVESAEYKWQARSLLAAQRQTELKQISAVVGRYEGNYSTLYSRLHNMRVSEELKSEHFRMVEDIKTLPEAVWPDPLKILLAMMALGLGGGLGLAFLAQTLDNRVQTMRDVEEDLGLPFLGGVPYWVHSGLERGVRPIVSEAHSAGATEAYRALRTSILAAMKKMGEKTLIVTSADSKEGKTLTVLNLGIMIAQMGPRVLLVDMDLRRGRLHRSLEANREPGLSEALRGEAAFADVIRPTSFERLDIAPSGAAADDAAELLQTCSLEALLAPVLDRYDYILVDTPPVLRVTDTVALATQGYGATMYVARVNATPKPMIRYSLDLLKDARVIGMVVNSIEMHRIGSLYYTYQYPSYAYYSNAYRYGHTYYYTDEAVPARNFDRRHVARRERWRKLRRWFGRTFMPME